MSHVLTTHLPLATFFRLLLPDLLPEYGTLLYLDADTIALTDVAELFATDLGEACVAAVPDLHVNGFIRDGATNYLHRTAYRDMNWTGYAVKLLGLDPADPGYFNAGVALLDLARIRSEGLDKAMLAFLEKHQPLALCDQDVMNAVLARKKRLLPLEWNIKGDLLHPLWPARQVRAAMRHPRILHYRFWQYGTPLSGHYWRYLALTPFAGTVKRGLFSYPLIYAPAKVSHSLWKALRGCIRSKKS
jgi:lipopolysaccharide biosynthesis glycosyltransferase